MEPLLKQLRELPKRFAALPSGVKQLSIVVLSVVIIGAIVAAALMGGNEGYQYVFTNLTSEDSGEAANTLKAAKIPFRLEANGAALAVPASRVYEARLLLATNGLPRGGGVGFELFDRGDLGVSEFTQRVNLRRATEGELARTVGRLSEVRSARVHLTLPEKGLFRDDERKASAAVVLNLHPGRTIGERELLGIRHLVASAVAGLAPEAVTIVDGRGTVLSAQISRGEEASRFEHQLERDLETRVVSLLESAVGPGAVVAKITADVDSTEVDTQAEAYDPDTAALRSERKVSQSQSQDSTSKAGVAGAAANQPLSPATQTSAGGSRGASNLEDEIRNFEISKTVTKTLSHVPRLRRLSVAILIDGIDGKPRSKEEITRLGELAKRAVGYDDTRGDQFDISSVVFSRSTDQTPAAAVNGSKLKPLHYALIGGGALVLLGLTAFLVMRGKRHSQPPLEAVLRPGAKVGELMAEQSEATPALLPKSDEAVAALSPQQTLQEKARALAAKDPVRAAHLLRAWMAADVQGPEQPHG